MLGWVEDDPALREGQQGETGKEAGSHHGRESCHFRGSAEHELDAFQTWNDLHEAGVDTHLDSANSALQGRAWKKGLLDYKLHKGWDHVCLSRLTPPLPA